MKCLSGLLLLLFTLPMHADAQKIKEAGVPVVVRHSFKKQYPDASNFGWEKEEGYYKASFLNKDQKAIAVYTSEGIFKELNTIISPIELSYKALRYISTNYKETGIIKVTKKTLATKQVSFEAILPGVRLFFDADGTFVKVEKQIEYP